ncbi:MAG: cupin domain-containing protein [Oscillospiraceae bacterium]|nr:cupin domain-containing protein [Oscillospiraceae bacterium]
MESKDFFTPPKHVNFLAKRLYGKGQISDISIARLGEKGGGPTENHTHPHGHFFIVTEGEAKIILGDDTVILRKNESFFVDSGIPHSVWNNRDEETVMIGINIEKEG